MTKHPVISLYLFYIDYLLKKCGVKKTYEKLKKNNKHRRNIDEVDIRNICNVVNSVVDKHFLRNRAKCLHRSLLCFLILSKKGIDTKLMIGASIENFEAHAWLEYNNKIINDNHELIRKKYRILKVI